MTRIPTLRRLLLGLCIVCVGAVAAQIGTAAAPATETHSPQTLRAVASRTQPVVMAGEWEHHAAATLYTGRWQISIEDEKPDGALAGTLTFWDIRCNARAAAMSGRRSDKKLSVEARIGVCGRGEFDLEEVAPGHYAGTFSIADAGPGEKKATLAVR